MALRGVRRVLALAATSSRRLLALQSTPAPCSLQTRRYSSDSDFVKLHPSGMAPTVTNSAAALDDVDEDEDDEDLEDMVAIGPSGVEYGGPTRGGKLKEPTRYGDWERKGRCSDF